MKIEMVITFAFDEEDSLAARYGAVVDVIRLLDSPDLEAGEQTGKVVVSVEYDDADALLTALGGGTPEWKDSEPLQPPLYPSDSPTGLE